MEVLHVERMIILQISEMGKCREDSPDPGYVRVATYCEGGNWLLCPMKRGGIVEQLSELQLLRKEPVSHS